MIDKKRVLILLFCVGLTGCTTYQSYILPTNYCSEADYVLDQFNKLNLKNTYKLRVLSTEEIKSLTGDVRPKINLQENAIYIEDLYLKYLYAHRNSKFYHIRNRDLACLIAHEICHREYNLSDKPLEVHFEVDKYAIEMLKQFNVDWYDYSGALIRANDYMKTRGGDLAYFVKNIPNLIGASSALYFGVGILWEEDLLARFYMVNDYYGGKDWFNNKAFNERREYDFSRKDDWEFNNGYKPNSF